MRIINTVKDIEEIVEPAMTPAQRRHVEGIEAAIRVFDTRYSIRKVEPGYMRTVLTDNLVPILEPDDITIVCSTLLHNYKEAVREEAMSLSAYISCLIQKSHQFGANNDFRLILDEYEPARLLQGIGGMKKMIKVSIQGNAGHNLADGTYRAVIDVEGDAHHVGFGSVESRFIIHGAGSPSSDRFMSSCSFRFDRLELYYHHHPDGLGNKIVYFTGSGQRCCLKQTKENLAKIKHGILARRHYWINGR